MSYKIYLFDALDAIEWSQAAWKVEGRTVSTKACDKELIRDVLLRYLPEDGLIVDAGCGVGRWPIYLRRRGYRVFGLEYSHEACGIARENDAGFEVVQSDVRSTPLTSDSVDALLSFGVVEHDERGPMEALREAYRVLKPGGTMILAVPFNNLFRRLFVNHVHNYVTHKRRRSIGNLGFAEYRFTASEVKGFLDTVGFEIVASYPNDLRDPLNMGLNMGVWVDYSNVFVNPLQPVDPETLFILPGLKGRIVHALIRHAPWLVCGEVVFVASKPAA